MINSKNNFLYKPNDSESERASNSYLMSLVAVIAGLPLPIINLVATLGYYLGNRKSTYFVKWHCMQALLSQLSLLPANSISFWWTISIIFGDNSISNQYVAYMFTIFIFNLVDFIATLYTAIETRKGNHIQWVIFSDLTNLIYKKTADAKDYH